MLHSIASWKSVFSSQHSQLTIYKHYIASVQQTSVLAANRGLNGKSANLTVHTAADLTVDGIWRRHTWHIMSKISIENR